MAKSKDWQRARSREQKDQRVQDILNAADQLFNQQGYEAVTLLMIAEAAGFTRSNLYRYFNTREAIFLDLYQVEHEKWVRQLVRALDGEIDLDPAAFVDIWTGVLLQQERLLALSAYRAASLEVQVAEDVLRAFRAALEEQGESMMPVILEALPVLEEADGRAFVLMHEALVAGLYPMARNDEQLQAAGTERVPIDFETQYRSGLLHYLLGVDAVKGGSAGLRMNRRSRNEITIGEND